LTRAILAVLNTVIDAEFAQALQLVAARGSRQHAGTVPLRQLNRGQPDAACARMHEHTFAGLEAPVLKQAVVGRAVRHGYRRRRLQRQLIRYAVGRAMVHCTQLSARAVGPDRRHAHADLEALHCRTDFRHDACSLITDDIRSGRRRRAPAIQQVSALDADGLDLNYNLLGSTDRIRNILVYQHIRTAILIVYRSFHLIPPDVHHGARRVDGR
jgi:hypothetical protein